MDIISHLQSFLKCVCIADRGFYETRLVLVGPRQCGSVPMLCLTLIHTDVISCVICPAGEVNFKLSEDVAEKDKRTRRCGQRQT